MKNGKVTIDIYDLDTREAFRVNSHIKSEFAKIAKAHGGTSFVLRKYMEKVVKNADKQKDIFEGYKDLK